MGKLKLRPQVRQAIMLGGMCSISYLAVYFARNILSPLTPKMIAAGVFTETAIGTISAVYSATYAIGQLINGMIGDKVKAKYMISIGLILAGVCSVLFPMLTANFPMACLAYGMIGFFLSMIYAPMSKLVAENTEPVLATRCALGYTFASFIGTPLAGMAGMLFLWQEVFAISSGFLIGMGAVCFVVFGLFERKGMIQYGRYKKPKEAGKGIQSLFRHQIVKYSMVSILTGVIRTSVVFWLPLYLTQHLHYGDNQSAMIYTVATLLVSSSAFVSLIIYESLGRKLDLSVFLFFLVSAGSFALMLLVKTPIANVVLIIVAILANNCSSSMLWNRYCPSLRDTGMVSSATGYLDFVHYLAASVANVIFPNLVGIIGWSGLLIVWFALMALAVVITIPWKRKYPIPHV